MTSERRPLLAYLEDWLLKIRDWFMRRMAETERPERCPTCGSEYTFWCNSDQGCSWLEGHYRNPWHASVSEVKPPATMTNFVKNIEQAIKQLASGNAVDHDSLSDPEYERLADKCEELSRYLDSIAESFHIAASPECTALLAQICGELSKSSPAQPPTAAGSSEPGRYLGNSENLLVFSDNAAGSQPMPIDPSPTPWDFSTWGFYCDECRTFFDLVTQGRVETVPGNLCGYSTYWHKACNKQARYIGYDRSPVRAPESAEQFLSQYVQRQKPAIAQYLIKTMGPCAFEYAEAFAAELRTKAFAASVAAGKERIRANKADAELSILRESGRNLRAALEAFERYDQNLPPQFGHDCHWCQECFEKLGTMRRAALAPAQSTELGAEDNPSVSKEPHENS